MVILDGAKESSKGKLGRQFRYQLYSVYFVGFSNRSIHVRIIPPPQSKSIAERKNHRQQQDSSSSRSRGIYETVVRLVKYSFLRAFLPSYVLFSSTLLEAR